MFVKAPTMFGHYLILLNLSEVSARFSASVPDVLLFEKTRRRFTGMAEFTVDKLI